MHAKPSMVQAKLSAEGLDNDAALDSTIKKLENDLKNARRKETGLDEDEGKVRLSVCVCRI